LATTALPLSPETPKGAGYDASRTALKVIFTHRKTEKLWVDKGRGFYNKHVKELSVALYSAENKEKSSVVERWDRTMKKRMYKYFTANDTQKYIDVLDKFVTKCNTTRHSSIQMTPAEASKKENEVTVFTNLYQFERLPSKPAKFEIEDKVRIRKKKGVFEKGYMPNWTEEIFIVSKIQHTKPISYKISDCNNEENQGKFCE